MQDDNSAHGNLTARDSAQLRKLLLVFTVILIVGGLAGAWVGFYKRFNPDLPYEQAGKISKDRMAVTRHQQVNGVDLQIPIPYFKTSIPSEGKTRDVLLIVMYPEFEPLKERPQKLWEQGKWDDKVVILFGDPTGRKTPPEVYTSLARSFSASEFNGEQHGLRYYSQPAGVENDGGELWIEPSDSHVASVINCGKIVSPRSNPQCSLHALQGGLWYDIGFDKDLLPHWKDIKDQSVALVESFKRKPASASSTSNNNQGE